MSFIAWDGENPGSRVYAVKIGTTGTATGNQDYTTSQLAGLTPKVIYGQMSRHAVSADPSEDAYAGIDLASITAASGLDSGFFCNNGVTTGATTGGRFGNRPAGTTFLTLVNSGAGTDKSSSLTSLLTEGVRLNWTTNSATDRRLGLMFFAGTGLTAYTNVVNLGTGTSAIDVTGPGFAPDCLIVHSNAAGMSGLVQDAGQTIGFATKDGTQRCVTFKEAVGTTSAPYMILKTNAPMAAMGTGLFYTAPVSDWDANGFSITPSNPAGSDRMGYIALKLAGGQAKIIDLTVPTSSGNQSITGVGFRPQAAIIVVTNLEAVDNDTGAASDLQCGYGIAFIADKVVSSVYRIKNNVSPQETRSLTKEGVILGPSNTSCEATSGTFVSWDADGMTINWTAVQAAGKKGFILFLS